LREIKAMKKEKDLFNPALNNPHLKIKSSRRAVRESGREQSRTDESERTDEQFFLDAMSDVTPLLGNRKKMRRFSGANIMPTHPAPDDEQEAMAHLYDLVNGSIELDITFSDEYMEGSVKGFNRKLMKQLKKGEFPVQDYIDLHGLTKQEAEKNVRDFLFESHRLGHRCLLIVHGRGLNSPDSFPVLKKRMPLWLTQGPVKKIVLAFSSAKPYDGGTGAIYVLLRRR
jgi:DNA-nicking Smr family endonuclease